MAAARLSSAISSAHLISRASSITCWPSRILSPAFSNSNIIGDARLAYERGDLLGVTLHQPEGGIDGATQPDQPCLAVLRQEPGRVELVVDGGRAEVPQDRFAGSREQRPARELVALPFADLGRGDVADVVDVKDEQRAEIGGFQRLPHTAQPVTMEPAIVDALLEIDAHGAERRERAAPVETGVDVLGADLADPVIHGGVS